MRTSARAQTRPHHSGALRIARPRSSSPGRLVQQRPADQSTARSYTAYEIGRIPIHHPPTPRVQAKLAEDRGGDALEREADRVADAVTGATGPIGGQSSAGDALLRADASPVTGTASSTTGYPLDASTRTFMESRFAFDFGRVRVHTNESAAVSARSIGALAYTRGREVVFGAGQYAPQTDSGGG